MQQTSNFPAGCTRAMTQPGANNHPLPPTPVSPGEGRWNEQSGRWVKSGGEDAQSPDSLQHTPPQPSVSVKRKAVPRLNSTDSQLELQLQHAPLSPVNISPPRIGLREPDTASIRQAPADGYFSDSRRSSGHLPESPSIQLYDTSNVPIRKKPVSNAARKSSERSHSRASSNSVPTIDEEEDYQNGNVPDTQGLQYHGFDDAPKKKKTQNKVSHASSQSVGSSSSGGTGPGQLGVPRGNTSSVVRPMSMMTLGSELRGRTLLPLNGNGSDPGSSPHGYRDLSGNRKSSATRPVSYVENLNNLPYSQQIAPGAGLHNDSLHHIVGSAASRMDTKKTLEMYRMNVKKTNDASVQYEFAIFMLNAAKEERPGDDLNPAQLVTEAKQILSRLADRAYPFAQYYLGDGYFSGLFNRDKPDQGKAFELFIAASKHGHAEAGYRVGLCYEFGWGTTKAYPKAVQFYRASASKNHPGAATRLGMACISGGMGLTKDKAREGVKWLKRAAESADAQYNAGPYELGLLHLTGFGDDIFKDEAYASQLLTQSAELGHVQSNFLMGQAYENGQLGCPRDAALSVHFYNGAAAKGHAEAMMALCAWYMVGAEPVLEKDEGEAYAWAKQAAETGKSSKARVIPYHPSRVTLLTLTTGFAKAEYAVGYFTEMGVGCRRDPLEANVWYVRAADQGNETAYQRLQIIRQAASGQNGSAVPMTKAEARTRELGAKDKKKFMGLF